MTPFQKLDIVLNYLANKFPLYAQYKDGDIFTALIKLNPEFDEQGDFGSELISILSKLQKDGFVDIDYGDTKPPGFHNDLYKNRYQITFEGIYFIKHQDGYQGLQNQKTFENTRLAKIEQKAKANQMFLTWLTILVAAGTLAQAAYALVKLYWEHHWFQLP